MPCVVRVACCLAVAGWIGCGDDGGGGEGCRQLYSYDWEAFIPGPVEEGFDQELEAVARRRDRQFHVFHAHGTGGVNTEISIAPEKTEERQLIVDFLEQDDGWDFEAFSGHRVEDVVDSWWKVAGMYGGAGVAADAFRYGVLRDQCYPPEMIDRAREQLLTSIAGLHRAVEITGIEGIARGYANLDFPGAGEVETTPLFDNDGNPLPAEKDNGTWREDNSGLHPDYVWEDSCSRDMLIGWTVGFGAVWEVIRDDPDIPEEVRGTLREDARAIMHNLMLVRNNGYDLELMDADGRTTFHGYLNENNLDRIYVDGIRNGFHTVMALGVVATFAEMADDPDIDAYLASLLRGREFAVIARENMMLVNLEEVTNFSNYNMVFDGAWLALRFIRDESARSDLRQALADQLYDTEDKHFQPVEQGQTWFDLVYAAGMCDAAAGRPCLQPLVQQAVDRGLQTLHDFPPPPFFEYERINCDQDEIDSGSCTAIDGTPLTVLGEVGRNGSLICVEPLPMAIRPPSNYYWRSNPYQPNGGSNGSGMFAGPDFRLGYWLGRWLRQ